MDLISSDNITKTSYHISKKKNYTRNLFSYKISNIVQKFNAVSFAKWMQNSFEKSKFKKQVDLVKFVKSNPATISRLMNATAQTINAKPSQPDKELVINLAEAFEQDINEALLLAGYAPTNTSDDELVADGLFDGYYELPEERRALARKQIAAIIRSLKDEDFE